MQARRPPPGRTRTLALPLAWCLAPPCGLHSYSGRCPQPAGRKGSAAPRNECPRCTDGLAGGTGDVEAHAVIAVSRETRPPRACPARCSRNPHTSDRRAAQTSHGTYNKYREPLFHFGCKSTDDDDGILSPRDAGGDAPSFDTSCLRRSVPTVSRGWVREIGAVGWSPPRGP